MTKTGRDYIEDVASRLDTATDDELGKAMAETARCFKYGPKVPPCRERPLMKDRCARCRVRMESDRRIARDEKTRSETTVNMDVVFKLADGHQTLEITAGKERIDDPGIVVAIVPEIDELAIGEEDEGSSNSLRIG